MSIFEPFVTTRGAHIGRRPRDHRKGGPSQGLGRRQPRAIWPLFKSPPSGFGQRYLLKGPKRMQSGSYYMAPGSPRRFAPCNDGRGFDYFPDSLILHTQFGDIKKSLYRYCLAVAAGV